MKTLVIAVVCYVVGVYVGKRPIEDRLRSNTAMAGFSTGWTQLGYWLTLYPLLLLVLAQQAFRWLTAPHE